MVVSTVKYGLIVDGLGVLVLPILGNFHLEGVKACDCSHEREKNGEWGELGQDRLEVRWEAVMFLFNVVNLNV